MRQYGLDLKHSEYRHFFEFLNTYIEPSIEETDAWRCLRTNGIEIIEDEKLSSVQSGLTYQLGHSSQTGIDIYAKTPRAASTQIPDRIFLLQVMASKIWQQRIKVNVVVKLSPYIEVFSQLKTTITHIPEKVTRRKQSEAFGNNKDLVDAFVSSKFGKYRNDTQERMCEYICDEVDCLVFMPTGAGKSVSAAAAVIAHPRKTHIFIVPFLALEQDVVKELSALCPSGVQIKSYNTEMNRPNVVVLTLGKALLFSFKKYLCWLSASNLLGIIIVDEVLLVIQDGGEGNPWFMDYNTFFKSLLELTYIPARCLLSGILPQDLAPELLQNACLPADCLQFRADPNRSNLRYKGTLCSPNNLILKTTEAASRWATSNPSRQGIIYGLTVDMCNRLFATISTFSRAAVFHGNLTEEEKFKIDTQFKSGEVQIVIATTAFGAGINNHNVLLSMVVLNAWAMINVKFYEQLNALGRSGRLPSLIGDCWIFAVDILTMPAILRAYFDPANCKRKTINMYLNGRNEICLNTDVDCDSCLHRRNRQRQETRNNVMSLSTQFAKWESLGQALVLKEQECDELCLPCWMKRGQCNIHYINNCPELGITGLRCYWCGKDDHKGNQCRLTNLLSGNICYSCRRPWIICQQKNCSSRKTKILMVVAIFCTEKILPMESIFRKLKQHPKYREQYLSAPFDNERELHQFLAFLTTTGLLLSFAGGIAERFEN
eukprot:Lithocolla_globosa_v1_NODE_449_length_4005_cov_11.872152.p1 type:complete len:715 gc:universal NODE_449_length_4005_cov_11.872152:1710-3854(+)